MSYRYNEISRNGLDFQLQDISVCRPKFWCKNLPGVRLEIQETARFIQRFLWLRDIFGISFLEEMLCIPKQHWIPFGMTR